MWRSVATRSRQLVTRELFATQKKQVQSQFQSHRFLSHSSANPSHDSITWFFRKCGSPSWFAMSGQVLQSSQHLGLRLGALLYSTNKDDEESARIAKEFWGSSDSSLDIAENGDSELDFVAGIKTNATEVLSFEGSVGDETHAYEIDGNKLENVLSLLQSKVDGSLESSLNAMDLKLHEDFAVKVLQTPYILGENLIRFLKWVMEKPEFKLNTPVVDSIVKVICSELKKKNAYDLWDLVKEIGEKENEVLTVNVLNELIALFSKLGKGKAAMEVFDKFTDFRCVPNEETYYFTIEALCRRSFYDWAWFVCEKMLNADRLPDGEQLGKIIYWFCKGVKAKDAHAVYLLAEGKNKNIPPSSVNVLISSLCKKDETVKLASEMLDGFSGEARKYAIKPFSAVVRGLCRMKNVDEAKKVLLKMIKQGPPPGNAVFNSVVNGYSKAGDMDKAKEIMKLMEDRGLKPDVYTYTVVMSGYANGGQMDQACEVLSEAKEKHTKLTPVTYHTLIRGYCKIEEFDKALKLLAEMKDFGVQPSVDEYNKLIQSLCLKVLDWQTAEKLLDEMKENGLHLNGITRSLITAVKEMEAEGMNSLEATTEV